MQLSALFGAFALLATTASALELVLFPRDAEPELFDPDWAPLTPRPGLKSLQPDTSPFAALIGAASNLPDSTDDNGPALTSASPERRAFSSLTARYEKRQGCAAGYGPCKNDAGTCCPVGGDCCGGGNCCALGDWCYATGCCNRADAGCDQKGCCPIGSQCCKGGSCCPAGDNCVIVDGKLGCCLKGKTCTNGPPTCSSAGYVLCPSQEYCCPAGAVCVRDSNNTPQCRNPSQTNPPPPPTTSTTTTTRRADPTPTPTPTPTPPAPTPTPTPTPTPPVPTTSSSTTSTRTQVTSEWTPPTVGTDTGTGKDTGTGTGTGAGFSSTSTTSTSARSTSTRLSTTFVPSIPSGLTSGAEEKFARMGWAACAAVAGPLLLLA